MKSLSSCSSLPWSSLRRRCSRTLSVCGYAFSSSLEGTEEIHSILLPSHCIPRTSPGGAGSSQSDRAPAHLPSKASSRPEVVFRSLDPSLLRPAHPRTREGPLLQQSLASRHSWRLPCRYAGDGHRQRRRPRRDARSKEEEGQGTAQLAAARRQAGPEGRHGRSAPVPALAAGRQPCERWLARRCVPAAELRL